MFKTNTKANKNFADYYSMYSIVLLGISISISLVYFIIVQLDQHTTGDLRQININKINLTRIKKEYKKFIGQIESKSTCLKIKDQQDNNRILNKNSRRILQASRDPDIDEVLDSIDIQQDVLYKIDNISIPFHKTLNERGWYLEMVLIEGDNDSYTMYMGSDKKKHKVIDLDEYVYIYEVTYPRVMGYYVEKGVKKYIKRIKLHNDEVAQLVTKSNIV